jgi:diguanylate cyclase (GGDEF)-like protein/PAS domain S-box-containing protein
MLTELPLLPPAKILIVDDISANIFSLKLQLKSLEHIEVVEANSGEQALSQVLRHEFAVILMDVQMPGMDGFETAEVIRDNLATAHVPIIFVTAISKEEKYVFHGYDIGAVDYLYKPVNPVVLRSKLKVFIDLYRQQQQTREAYTKMKQLHRQQLLLLRCAGEGIIELGLEGDVIYANPAACSLLAYGSTDIQGKNCTTLLNDDILSRSFDSPLIQPVSAWIPNQIYRDSEAYFRSSQGVIFPVDYTAAALTEEDNRITGGVLIFQDISDRKEVEKQLIHMAKYDQLTGLANRRMFKDFLDNSMIRATRHKRIVALLFIDLDHFKQVNDTLGHDIGDLLLKSVANRLQLVVRKTDLVARLGGDEFAIILDDISCVEDALRVGQKILVAMAPAHQLAGHELIHSPSIGVAIYPNDTNSAEGLIKAADKAMYHSKRHGRNQVQVYLTSMQEAEQREQRFEQELRYALEHNELVLFYQPIVDSQDFSVRAIECLIRWQHPSRGLVAPGHFIEQAEKLGLINEIGFWVVLTACQQGKIWQQSGHFCRLSVNLSVQQLKDANFVEHIANILESTGFDARWLEFELTESTIMDDPEKACSVLNRIQALGARIAIDDFGTGYSSLSYLRHLPVDTLKIDRSFIRDIGRDSHCEAIIKSTVTLAHSLKLQVVAEGVETEEQALFLREQQCEWLQGYHFYKPMPVNELTKLPWFSC